jgi:hypothetical protein
MCSYLNLKAFKNLVCTYWFFAITLIVVILFFIQCYKELMMSTVIF